MEKYHILFNPLANNGRGGEDAKQLNEKLKEAQLDFQSVLEIKDYEGYLRGIPADEKILICGGDGTIHQHINRAGAELEKHSLYYFPAGSGNDFMKDIQPEGAEDVRMPVEITKYVKNLPIVTVKGKSYRFLDNVGFGIDGYCCEEGDRLRAKSEKKINYTAIAIKGLLYRFHPANAVITVDGETKNYKKVWLAPTMKGRYYGGGMKVTPDQDRMDPEHKVSVAVMWGANKLKTLMVFPSIFEGKHVAHTEMVAVVKGYEVDVTFDRPTALQIDGETIVGVTNYHVSVPRD